MSYILSVEQQGATDLYTIAQEPIAAIDLMERAATAFTTWFAHKFEAKHPVIIVCGNGNNGGDGMAIARLLWQQEYTVKVFFTEITKNQTSEFTANYARLREKTNVVCTEITDIPTFYDDFIYLQKEKSAANCIVIDALLGTGISQSLAGQNAQIINILNSQKNITRIALDVPSGMFCDKPNSDNLIFNAGYTATFHSPKLAFFLPEAGENVGELAVLNIGLNDGFLLENELPYHVLNRDFIKKMLKNRPRFAHKGSFGHALLIAGSYGMMGAAVLATQAALRSGVGLVTAHTPRKGVDILQIKCPEALCSIDDSDFFFSDFSENASIFTAIAVGCGIGQNNITKAALKDLLLLRRPLIIDADALNIIATNNWQTSIPPNSILTPHPKEIARLFGETQNSLERLHLLQEKAAELAIIIVLKGAFTAIAVPDGNIYFNTTGNNGLAKGGSGDTLTGLMVGLLAQGYSPQYAAMIAVFQHGAAADIAATMLGETAMLPSDLVQYFGNAI